MMKATLEDRKVLITSGTDLLKIRSIAHSRPFTQQVDVAFSANAALQNTLLDLQLTYHTCESLLSDFLRFAKPHINQITMESKIVAHGLAGSIDNDVWSLDSRGVLTLAVGKQTYESLGLVGERLPWKEFQDTHVIHLSIGEIPHNDMNNWLTYGAKEAAALFYWDMRRGPWKIMYYLLNSDDDLPANTVAHQLQKSVYTRPNIHIPLLKHEELVIKDSQQEDVEDWEDRVSALFEWVGMATLGSQRLSAADRCDPYISVYASPEPSRVGELTVIRWRGFVPPSFIQAVLDTVLSPNFPLAGFFSMTAHSVPMSPVTYVPARVGKASPLRAPRADSEDTWSLVYAREDSSTLPQGCYWVLAESIGRWDRRWG